jgi:hypothetical protein
MPGYPEIGRVPYDAAPWMCGPTSIRRRPNFGTGADMSRRTPPTRKTKGLKGKVELSEHVFGFKTMRI